MVVPRADWRMRATRGDDAEFRKWRSANEALVGIYFVRPEMIDGQQTHLVKINSFFHRLHEPETKQAIPWMNTSRVDLEIFIGIRNIALAGCDPMANDAGANHVGNEFVFAAIPGEENGARAAAAAALGA